MRLQIQDPTCRADVDWDIESEIEWSEQCNELMNALFNDDERVRVSVSIEPRGRYLIP